MMAEGRFPGAVQIVSHEIDVVKPLGDAGDVVGGVDSAVSGSDSGGEFQLGVTGVLI